MQLIANPSHVMTMSTTEKEKLRDAVRMSITVSSNYLMGIKKVPERWQTVIDVERNLETLQELLDLLARE